MRSGPPKGTTNEDDRATAAVRAVLDMYVVHPKAMIYCGTKPDRIKTEIRSAWFACIAGWAFECSSGEHSPDVL